DTQGLGTITNDDAANAVSILCPADASIECGSSTDPSATGTATASGGCTTPTVTYSDSETPGSNCTVDHTVKTIARTWTASDTCGNSATCTQTITVNDTTAPSISFL